MAEAESAPLTSRLTPSQRSEGESHDCSRRDCAPCIPARYVLAVMTCLGFAILYGLRVNLSVAIVQMDNSTTTVHKGSAKVFNWSDTEEGWVLAAFFYGYLLTQIPGGWLAQRVGGKWVLGVGIFVPSVLTIFTPLAASKSVWLLVALRVLEGLFEGVTFPSVFAMWGRWAPPLEKSRLLAITFIGIHFGDIISFPLSGVLCQYGFDGGWPSVFYLFGILGILWFCAWIFLAYSSPATHPRISRKEKEYIQFSIAVSTEKQLPTPWLKLLTSPAVWAIMVANFCYGVGFFTLLTCMPTYFKQVLPRLQISNQGIILSGVYSAIPSIGSLIVIALSGQVADFLRANYLSTVIVRKMFTLIAFTGGTIGLLLCGYLGTSTATAVTFLTLSSAVLGLSIAGTSANVLDIAPRYAGVINGLTNLANNLPGIIGPQVAKAIAIKPNAPKGSEAYLNGYRDEWREVFIITAEVYIFGALVFLILASGKKQSWADGPRESGKEQSTTPPEEQNSGSLSRDKASVNAIKHSLHRTNQSASYGCQ